MENQDVLEAKVEEENELKIIPKDLFRKTDLIFIYGPISSFGRYATECAQTAVEMGCGTLQGYIRIQRIFLRSLEFCATFICTLAEGYAVSELYNLIKS